LITFLQLEWSPDNSGSIALPLRLQRPTSGSHVITPCDVEPEIFTHSSICLHGIVFNDAQRQI